MNPSKLRTVSSGFDLQTICSGYCHRCGEEHVLPEGNVRRHCLELMEIFKKKKRIYAAGNGLISLGIAEFYWGRENPSASRQHGGFYPPCTTKCRPILGFMLCGLSELRDG